MVLSQRRILPIRAGLVEPERYQGLPNASIVQPECFSWALIAPPKRISLSGLVLTISVERIPQGIIVNAYPVRAILARRAVHPCLLRFAARRVRQVYAAPGIGD